MKTLAWMVRNRTLLTKKPATVEPRRRVIVVERSAEDVARALDASEFEETIVVAETRAELGPSLALRVAGRIAQLEQRGTPACSATLVLGHQHDAQGLAARELVARSLLSHLKATGGNELTISAPEPHEDESEDVLGLVDRLLSELDSQSITIRLKFSRSRLRHAGSADTLTLARALQEAS